MSDELGRVVQAGYDAAAASYARLEHDAARWPRAAWVRALMARLPQTSEILDLGCATGVPTAAELAGAHHVTGVDISPAQIAQAAANVPAAEFLCADIRAVEFPPERSDAVVSLYTFDHVPRSEHLVLLERVYRWLRPGGLLLLSIEDSDEPGRVVEWLGVDMHFSMFDADTTRRLVREAGFTIESTAVEMQREDASEIPYTWVLARKL